MLYEVIPTKIFRSGANFLTYKSDLSLKPGQVILVPLGKSTTPGIIKSIIKPEKDTQKAQNTPETTPNVVNFTTFSSKTPKFTIKSIIKPLYSTPLPPHLLKSLLWLGEYYLLPLPSVASLFLPVGVEKSRRKPKTQEITQNPLIFPNNPPEISPKISLNSAQKEALDALNSSKEATKLLFGITGSGKTNIYLSLAKSCLEKGQSTILLVPEIALTSQLVQVFETTFSRRVTLIHSRETESERHQIWESLLSASEKNEAKIVIGPRSALFAPLKNLGLIIIDEAHESAYYQENSPKYSAIRLASFIAKTKKIPCILGSATPTVADYYLASSHSSLVTLNKKAKDTAVKPEISVIDLKNRENFHKNRYFSDKLLETIEKNLKNGHQTLIFHNRRGSSPLTICEKCGYEALCPSCFLPLTLHSDSFSLICHSCGFTTPLPHSCPSCHTPGLIHKGYGTKLLETELNKLFKDAKIARFDADNKKSETVDTLYGDLHSGKINIIIGTQTIAKGLDLPHLASVGVVQADSGLNLPDFSSEEKTFQLLTQVIGRVGRGHLPSASVIIQTYQPDHPVIRFALSENYPDFANYTLKTRQKQSFPPYFFLAKISVTMKTEKTVLKKITEIHSLLKSNASSKDFLISPPTPVFHERSTTGFSWQITLRARSRLALISALKSIPNSLNAHIIIDPPSLL